MTQKMKALNFKISEDLHTKLKSVAISKKTNVAELVRGFIEEKINALDMEAAREHLMRIPPAERLNLIHEVEEEEKKAAKK